MTDCYCDYDSPIWSHVTHPTAKQRHRCTECGATINPGEKYERACGMWPDGDVSPTTFKLCHFCVDLRDFVRAHVPCLCWAYGNIIDDCIEAAREYAHETSGLLFGAYRRQILIQRAPR